MDWKDILASKVAAGELQREDSTPSPAESDASRRLPLLHVAIEKKGRKGKTATIVYGFDPEGADDDLMEQVARSLKQSLATGGSARGGEILIQGDCADRVRTLLVKMGYKVK